LRALPLPTRRSSDLLVAYLLDENPDMADSGDLFNYFLIDVKMNACQLTSRLKQAISSVQLFVQRCFLNLESERVQIPKDDPDLEDRKSTRLNSSHVS